MGRLRSKKIDPKENNGCEIKLRWRMKPSKTGQAGGRKPTKTFLKDDSKDALSLAADKWHILCLKENHEEEEEENTPLFADEGGREITIAESRRWLNRKVEEAVFGDAFIKNHSLRIGGATTYENSPERGALTAVSIGLWTSVAR